MTQSDNRIYYVVSYDGQCTIKEIDTIEDKDHKIVFEIKSEKCNGLYINENSFYFIDD